ncbi:MAG: purine-nucleoside phosphorylase, partial [Eubacteriales bacterium]|nr:purine-nucleoside phosphorylase [Eubacteriales bacterium]
ENKIVIDYADIPNFLLSTVQSHAGKLIFGNLNGVQVVCMSGRFHYYEGYDFEQLTAPIRLFKLLGVKATILTNAAGGINESYKAGDLMIIKDHIKLAGASPLRGKNVDEFGDRFFDTSDMYTESLRNIAKAAIPTTELTVHEGVYYYAVGPNFETPAEIRAMRILGGDAVGMSTVTEALTAAHCKMPLLAISLITNMAAGVLAQPITVEEVDETAQFASKLFREYLKTIIANI